MPCEYWPIIRANRWLLGEMNRLAADVILTICRDLNVTPGVFTAIHTWGRDQKWHPHIHFSTTAGGVTKMQLHEFRNLQKRSINLKNKKKLGCSYFVRLSMH